jgi:predicted secreted protein|tara:strand:- start:1307 stop:1693 length:387 start_codon:yes stop_codon:yes gene_type:complete
MAADLGRNTVIKTGSTVIVAVRSLSVEISNTAVDITTNDSSGFRTYLSDPGEKSVNYSVEGISSDPELRAAAATGTGLMITDATIEYYDGATLTGDVYLSSFTETNPYNDAITFSATLESSGAFDYTP